MVSAIPVLCWHSVNDLKKFIWVFDCCCCKGVTLIPHRFHRSQVACIEDRHKQWLLWSSMSSPCSVFCQKSPFGYWPTSLSSFWVVAGWGIRSDAPLKSAQGQWPHQTRYLCSLSCPHRRTKPAALQESGGRVPRHTHGTELVLTLMRALWLNPTQLSNWRG